MTTGTTMADDDEQLRAFGEFVRAQRQLAQVSQRNLARMSGVSDSYLSQLERGQYRPSPQVLKALAAAFGLEPKQLYTMLGFMDEDETGSTTSVEQAIQLDSRLDAGQKDALIKIYRSLIGGS
jgi:transcriptional regulator with XRE-family HTH domain